jgi:hypothetical protein
MQPAGCRPFPGRFGDRHARRRFRYSEAMKQHHHAEETHEPAILNRSGNPGRRLFLVPEAVYLEARGVTRVESGYMGGAPPSARPTNRCAPAPPAMPKWCGWNSIRT